MWWLIGGWLAWGAFNAACVMAYAHSIDHPYYKEQLRWTAFAAFLMGPLATIKVLWRKV